MIHPHLLQDFYDRADWSFAAAEYVRVHGIDVTQFEVPAISLAVIPCLHYNGRFHFDEGGTPSVVIEVTWRSEPVDLVAWTIEVPEKISVMTGEADGLGCDQVEAPWSWYERASLPVHRTPLGWLKAGCIGVCILNYRTAPVWLSKAIGKLEAEDREHAIDLHSLLNIHFPRSRIAFVLASGSKEAA